MCCVQKPKDAHASRKGEKDMPTRLDRFAQFMEELRTQKMQMTQQ